MEEFLNTEVRLTIGEICAHLDELYPPHFAESWDKNGLICGNRGDKVSKILLAVDPIEEVAQEAIAMGVQMIITHHPLFLRGTSSVSTDTSKGRVIHELIRAGICLFNAHTNADSAPKGVAHALAQIVGLNAEETLPLVPSSEDKKIGIGRVGELAQDACVEDIALRLANFLPSSPGGILIGGDLEKKVRKIAVSPGAGDSLMQAVKESGAQLFITADLRHHPASEFLEENDIALISPTHWASEWMWLPVLQSELELWSASLGQSLNVSISNIISEPWSAYIPTVLDDYEDFE